MSTPQQRVDTEQAAARRARATEAQIRADLDLCELVELHEDVTWRDVPGVSNAEAAAWTARLAEARERLQEEM